MNIQIGKLKLEINPRKVWNEDWRKNNSKTELIYGYIGILGTTFCTTLAILLVI